MKSLSLLILLLLCRITLLAGREISPSVWTPLAYIWQDLLFLLLFHGLMKWVQKPCFQWTLYLAAVVYLSINLPLMRLLSTPFTLALLRATSGTLSDSIRHHLQTENIVLIAAPLALGLTLPFLLSLLARSPRLKNPGGLIRSPFWLKQHGWRASFSGIIAAGFLLGAGRHASARVDTAGLDRNVFFALIQTVLPRMAGRPDYENWRASPWPVCVASHNRPTIGSPALLAQFRGKAAGRNVVLILLESAGAQYLKPYGAEKDPMPHLSALARQSILFENAYAVYPESIKGLFSVLCSRTPAFDVAAERYDKVRSPSVSGELSRAGYRTGLFHSGRFIYLGMEQVVHDRGFQTLADAGTIGGNEQSSFGVDEPSTVTHMLRWIDQSEARKPFFLTYLPIAGHHPYHTPQPGPFPPVQEVDRYLNALYCADQALGQLLQGLTERGLLDETVFFIFGDHGEAFGQHDGNYGHTLSIYEENVHVPYLIAAPGLLTKPIRVSRPVSLLDTGPSILDFLGLASPPQFQGETLFRDDSSPTPSSIALFFTDYSLGWLGLRDQNWKCIVQAESGRCKLFHLKFDPEEKIDLAPFFPDRARAYSKHLQRWTRAAKAEIEAML